MELGMDDTPCRKGQLSRGIRNHLIGSTAWVFIDEADHLDYPTVEELRILQEETGVSYSVGG
ncbi:hypothetical protein [Candidatus Enterovibrio escicola]|uniref:hypothetical protein n=2 Tax=Candidatus Enterovibrio escicola TaxID=1927127 RepID=UPI001CC268A3|nr:hypothetical protein [Candidatus Enterovibrio escacola]